MQSYRAAAAQSRSLGPAALRASLDRFSDALALSGSASLTVPVLDFEDPADVE